MRDYGTIRTATWTGETGNQLKKAGYLVRVMYHYVKTCPSSNWLGLYYCPITTMAHEIGCPIEGARRGLRSLAEMGHAFYDEASEHVWVPRMAAEEIGETLKPKDMRTVGISKTLQGLKHTPFFNDFLDLYKVAFHLDSLSPIDPPSMPLGSPLEAIDRDRTMAKDNTSTQTTAGESEEFEHVWQVFPRRVGKEAARKAWSKLNGSRPSVEILLAAITCQKQSAQWIKDDGQFIPHLATWLNQHRWNDEVVPRRHIPTSLVELL
jgi:hypothetical protein